MSGLAEKSTPKKRNVALTSKQQRYAENVASGRFPTSVAAYRNAYEVAPTVKPEHVHVYASKLSKNAKVVSVIDRLRLRYEAERARAAVGTKNYVLRALREESEGGTDGATASTRVRALELLGKSVGMFSEVVETRDKQPESEAEVLASLEALLAGD
jgi:hypothetical protein